MTQEEFNTHHKEFLMSFNSKYRLLDLDFKTVMTMKGLSEEEFDQKIKQINNPQWGEWVDEDNDEWDSYSSHGGDDYDGEDSNEY